MISPVLFSLVDKAIVVTDLATGAVVWAGRPLGRTVIDLVQVADGSRAVALLDYYGAPPEERPNLVGIDRAGQVVWRAPLPTTSSTDAFTEIELLPRGVSAFSWSGHRVLIDALTGEIIKEEFTK